MAELSTTHILEVREGIGVPDSIALEPGRAMEPTSVGTLGDWRVDAPGVHDVHAYVYFDGGVFYAMSAEAHDPLLVDDKPVGTDWTPLRPPARMVMGRAQIVFRALNEEFEDTTEVNAPPKPPPRPFAPGAFARKDDDEATRLEPVGRREKTPARPAPPRPAAGRPPLPAQAPNDEPTRIGAPIEDRAMSTAARSQGGIERPPPSVIVAPPIDLPPPAAPPSQAGEPSVGSKIAGQWKEASFAKKAQLLLMPFALVAMWVIFKDDEAPPPSPKPAASAHALASASAPASASASAIPTSTTVTTAVLTPLPPADAGKATPLEHDAVEAVAAGNYAQAIRLYDQLSVMHPDKEAYREAARILRAKKDAGL